VFLAPSLVLQQDIPDQQNGNLHGLAPTPASHHITLTSFDPSGLRHGNNLEMLCSSVLEILHMASC